MPKQSPLTEFHKTNGAKFAEEDGWILPIHFGDSLREYQAARSEVGLLDLCHRGLLRFTGPDRVSYLQGMVSNDVSKLAAGEGTYAAVLDVHGKILADTRIFCTEEFFLVDLWESLKEKILTHLNRYLIADEVEIADLTGQYGIISLQGPKAKLFLRELLPQDEISLTELEHRISQIGESEVRLIRSTHTGEEGYDLLISMKDHLPVVSHIQEIGKTICLQWIGTQAQEILRIEAGIPRYGVDMDEDHLLLEIGLDNAVSFQKGCYLGQEVVERIRSRGHVNKKLAGLSLEGDRPAERGDKIHVGEKEVGEITSSTLSPTLKHPLALAYLLRDYLQPGTRVSIDHNGKTLSAEVSALPFYKSS